MPYTTLVAATTITAAWANANCRDQVVTPFATTAARDSAITAPVEGMVACITGDDLYTVYNGSAWVEYGRYGAWTTYTPTLAQGASSDISKTVAQDGSTFARYMRIGSLIRVQVRVVATGAGTSGSIVTMSLPVAPVYTGTDVVPVGQSYYQDTGTAQYMGITCLNGSKATMVRSDAAPTNFFGADPVMAVANTDIWSFSAEYEAA